MAYLNQPWFNREIINRFAMATGVVHSQTLTVIKRSSRHVQKLPVTPCRCRRREESGVHPR
jgi:hypothetical protein